MTPDSTLRRRDVLRGGIALGAIPLAGCTGGDPAEDDPGDETDDPSNDVSDPEGDGIGEIGQPVSGEYASLTVEYVRPIEEVRDYSDFPDIGADVPYGAPVTVEDLQAQGFVQPGAELYSAGIAVKNTSDHLLDIQTLMFENDEFPANWVFLGRSQRLAFARGHLLPGELARAEVVAALHTDVTEYRALFMPMQVGSGRTDQLRVDLGSGSEGDANYDQSPPVSALDESIELGNFDVTIHSTEFVEQVEDTFRPEKFGPRPGYRYLLLDLTATRTSDVLIPSGGWRVGVRATDGYGFAWGAGLIPMGHDVAIPNQPRVDQLAVDETLEHTTVAYVIEEDFDPGFLTIDAPGPMQNPPEGGQEDGMNRAIWPIQ